MTNSNALSSTPSAQPSTLTTDKILIFLCQIEFQLMKCSSANKHVWILHVGWAQSCHWIPSSHLSQWGWHFLSCFSHQFTSTYRRVDTVSSLPTYSSVRWCRMSVSPLVQSNLNWHAFYMLCDPMWIFYEPRPVFHVHISSWASEPHTFLMHIWKLY